MGLGAGCSSNRSPGGASKREVPRVPRMTRLGACLVCTAVWLAATQAEFLLAQTSAPSSRPQENRPKLIPRSHEEREQRFVTQHRIILNVHVSDAAGKPYMELEQNDFALYDNEQERKIVSFRPIRAGTTAAADHVIVVLDTVNNFTRPLHYFEREIEKYLTQEKGPLPLPVAVGVFSGSHISVGEASRDREALITELKEKDADLHATGCITEQDHEERIETPGLPRGAGARAESATMLTCLNNRFVSSINALRQLAMDQVDQPGRVILIWIGPGWPLLTNRSFAPDPPALKESFFAQLVGVSIALREAQVTLDAIASPDDLSPNMPGAEAFLEGISNEDQIRAGNLGLHALAHQTGGHIETDSRDIAGQISRCIVDAESYYALSFDSPPAAAFGEYHTLAVKVNKPGLDVRTNTVYYAEQ
jgi:VWFA-related protein